MKLSKIKEIFNAYGVMLNPSEEQSRIGAERLEICNSCKIQKEMDFGFGIVKVCGGCGCVLRAKAFTNWEDGNSNPCPENKWKK